jgi:hypothetical protein
MGLPLEEGEGDSPSLFPVEVAHVEPHPDSPAAHAAGQPSSA